MEFTLSDMSRETKFNKRQITNWYKQGILPSPIREENTGRKAGIILYFSEEALHRLRSIQNYPVTSLTKTMGLDALAFILFLFGFSDENLNKRVQDFLVSTLKYFQKSLKKEEKEKGREALLTTKLKEDHDLETPTELMLAALGRMMGEPKKEVKKILPLDTGNELFDGFLGQIQRIAIPLLRSTENDLDLADFLEKYLITILTVIPGIPSLKEMKEIVLRFSDNDFKKFQLNLLLSLQFLGMTILSPQKINEILREKIQINSFRGFALAILYVHFIVTKKMGCKNDEVYEYASELLKDVQDIAEKPLEKKKTRRKKSIPEVQAEELAGTD